MNKNNRIAKEVWPYCQGSRKAAFHCEEAISWSSVSFSAYRVVGLGKRDWQQRQSDDSCGSPSFGRSPTKLVCYTAFFRVVTQRSSWGGSLRDDAKNGCVADYNKAVWPKSACLAACLLLLFTLTAADNIENYKLEISKQHTGSYNRTNLN